MTATTSSPTFEVLRNLELRTEPYSFFTSTQAFDPLLAGEMLRWFETTAEWHLHRGSFYEQWECDLLRADLPAILTPLFSPGALARLAQRMGEVFNAELSDRFTVIAHKLVDSQAIAVHNDDPEPGYETHRLVVQLNRGREGDVGGDLIVHRSNQPSDIELVVAPAHNTAFGFAMSARSYHSVTPVLGWTRYTIIFSFWTKVADAEATRLAASKGSDAAGAGAIAAALSTEERDRLAQLTTLLQNLGARARSHSDDSLLAHLVHTYLILRSWGCSVDLATAGLFHSVYGTEDFHAATLQLDDRPLLQQIIGERAEEIAYHYCACSKKSLHQCLRSGPPYRVTDAKRNHHVELAEEIFQDLVILDLANEIEQQPRVHEEVAVLEERRSLFDLATPFMPERAIAALRQAYP